MSIRSKSTRVRRLPQFAQVSDTDWNSWQWQLKHRISSADDLGRFINLTSEELQGLQAQNRFRVDITPYFASLIDPNDPNCPIRRQVIPLGRELESFSGMMEDSLSEDSDSPVPGLVHRYPDRVLMLVTTHCASYCRYCTRSRMVGDFDKAMGTSTFEAQLDYLRKTPQVRDVLLSGGDPLTLSQNVLEHLLSSLNAIEHIEIVRIGSRVPVFLPQRITPELCAMLRKQHPLWMNVHVNHPKEITPEVSQAFARLNEAGIPLGNQSVLLAGINDSLDVQRELVHKLVRNRVRPYYLYQCDLVKGAGHFRTSIDTGMDIIRGLQGHTSGYAVPTYVIDSPGGGGKVPVMPQYLLAREPDGTVLLRNYEGKIATYVEPKQASVEQAEDVGSTEKTIESGWA